MFTGIIKAIGEVIYLKKNSLGAELGIQAKDLVPELELGDSLAVNGVCLTVKSRDKSSVSVDISRESLKRTTLERLSRGEAVNLEPALRLSDRLGGHLVTGHVDGVGVINQINKIGKGINLRVKIPPELGKYCVEKGSVALDGISLTLGKVYDSEVVIHVVPFTLAETTLKARKQGDRVNIESDILAKYLESIFKKKEDISWEILAKAGFELS